MDMGTKMTDVFEYDHETGESVVREFTPAELEQIELDRIASEELKSSEAAKLQAIASAIAKLQTLGLSEEEAKALLR